MFFYHLQPLFYLLYIQSGSGGRFYRPTFLCLHFVRQRGETEGTGQRPAHQMRWITPLTLLTSVATRQSLNALSIVLAAPEVNCADFCRDSTITEQAQMVLAAPKVHILFIYYLLKKGTGSPGLLNL